MAARKMLIDGEEGKNTQSNAEDSTHYDFDLFVVGAGSGGVRAARFSAKYGAKVCFSKEPTFCSSSNFDGFVSTCVPSQFAPSMLQFELPDSILSQCNSNSDKYCYWVIVVAVMII